MKSSLLGAIAEPMQGWILLKFFLLMQLLGKVEPPYLIDLLMHLLSIIKGLY